MKQHGWGRRNVWGVLALIPVTAALLAVYIERSGFAQPNTTSVVTVAGQDGWASYHGGRLRLIELSPAMDLRDTAGKPYKLTAGLAAWRAVIEYDVTGQDAFAHCELSLEDTAGRLFHPQPAELAGARLPATGCTAEDQALARYQTFIFFVLPAGTEPVAVRVSVQGPLAYARLTRN